VTTTNGITTSGFTSASAGFLGAGEAAATDHPLSPAARVVAPTVSVQIVTIDTSILTVAIPPPDATTGGASAVVVPPALDLSTIRDTEPPVLTLNGAPYITVMQTSAFADPGTAAFDNIDGSFVSPRSKLAVCRKPDGAEALPANDTRLLTCNATAYAAVNTSLLTPGWVWVYMYTAKDAAGNAAAPLRRYVEVTSRWGSPISWGRLPPRGVK
jgi:hypothetical protein